MRKTVTCFLLVFSCLLTNAQHRTLEAVKINHPIKIDGNLDDAAWQEVPATNDYDIIS